MNFSALEKKVYGSTLYQAAVITRAEMKKEERTVPVVFSTETPILHWFGYCILSHDTECVLMDRMNNRAAVLKDHDPTVHIGVVEKAEVDTKERVGRALIRFSRNHPAAEIEWNDILDEVRNKVSAGFQVRKLVPENGPDGKQRQIDGIPVYRAIVWEPCEISTVAIEADVNTGMNRALTDGMDDDTIQLIMQKMQEYNSQHNNNNTGENNMRFLNPKNPMNGVTDPPAGGGVNVQEVRAAEIKRMQTIDAMTAHASSVPNIQEIRSKAINDGWTADKFAAEVLPMMATRSVEIKPNDPLGTIGLSAKDMRGFSVRRAIEQLSTKRALDGVEKEINDHILKFEGKQAKELTIRVPVHMLMRDLSATEATKGAELVGTDVLTSEFIGMKRNRTVVEKAGARMLSGLVGNIAIPKGTGGATAYWLAEGATGNLSDQTFAQIAMTPHRLFGATAFTKQLVGQTAFGVEAFILEDIQTVLKIAKDLAALNGSGADGQPLGILNMTGLATSVTFGGAATFAKMIEFETNVATQNADDGALSYITTPAVRGKLKAKAKDGSNNGFVWEKGMVNDYPGHVTNQMPDNKVLFGNFNDLVIGEWMGVDITVDPYTLAADGKIRVIVEMHADMIARHTASFSKSTDSGAQ